jgi:hypothetical protein
MRGHTHLVDVAWGQELLFDFDDCLSSLSDTNCNVLDADPSNDPNPLRAVFQIGFCTGQISVIARNLAFEDSRCTKVGNVCNFTIPVAIRNEHGLQVPADRIA